MAEFPSKALSDFIANLLEGYDKGLTVESADDLAEVVVKALPEYGYVNLTGLDGYSLAVLHDHAAYALMGDKAAEAGLVALSHVIDALSSEEA